MGHLIVTLYRCLLDPSAEEMILIKSTIPDLLILDETETTFHIFWTRQKNYSVNVWWGRIVISDSLE